jgi:hypothetical protein
LWNGEQENWRVLLFMSKKFMIDICNSNVMKRTARCIWSVMNIYASSASFRDGLAKCGSTCAFVFEIQIQAVIQECSYSF